MASEDTTLRATLETLGDVAFTVDGEGRYDLVTDGLAALHGTEPEKLAGEESVIVERLYEYETTEADGWTAFRDLVAGDRDNLRVEVEFDDAGERTILDLRLSRHTVDGEFDTVVVVGWDVTEDRRRRIALEALHDVATSIQTEDTVIGVAERTVRAAETILDFDNCIIFRPDGDRMTVLSMSEEFPAEEIESLPIEGSVAGETYRTGEVFNVGDAQNHPIANPQGPYESGLSVPIGDHGVCQMISTEPHAFDAQDREFAELLVSHTTSAIDRIERERDLRMYEAIVEAVDAGVYVVDDERYIEFVNESYVEMKGVERSEFLGTQITEWGNDSDIERIVEQVEQIRRGERDMVKIDYEFRSVDGEEFPVELRISPLFFPDGEPGRVGIIRDISERKRYEHRLEEQADQLETLNRIVRHDISNDMNVVLGMTQAVRERLEDQQLADHLDRALAATRHTIELTRTVRDLMKTMLAEDRERTPISLPETVDAEIDDVAEGSDAEIRVEGSIPDVSVLADNLLSSVFRNLLTNAVQHNDAADPEVIVTAEPLDGYVRVSVADNGPGIPDDRKDEIFGKGDAGLNSAGTGIGLYLVRTLVDSYDGSIRVEDRENGSGSVFTVELERASTE